MVAHALGIAAHDVSVECRRMGGGFGGKEIADVAVRLRRRHRSRDRTGRAVKLRLDRDDDMCSTGKRHAFHYEYDVGFDDEGRILGLDLTLASRCGFSADLSGPVNDRAIFHVDNAYWLPERRDRIRYRLQDQHGVQHGVPRLRRPAGHVRDRVRARRDRARSSARDPLDVRRANFYGVRATQRRRPTACRSRTTCVRSWSPTWRRPRAIANAARTSRRGIATSPVLKRGIALTPVKFGISFTATHYNQAGALVHVYGDGTRAARTTAAPRWARGSTPRSRRSSRRSWACRLAACASRPPTPARCRTPRRRPRPPAATSTAWRRRPRADAARAPRRLRAPALRLRGRGRRVRGRHRPRGRAAVRVRGGRARWPTWRACSCRRPASTRRRSSTTIAKTLTGRPFYYFAYGAAVSEVVDRHADRRAPAARGGHPARRRRVAQSGDRPRADRRRLHPGHGLADDGGTALERRRGTDDPRAVDLQDSDRARHARRISTSISSPCANREATIHRSKAVGRAAAHARALGLSRTARRRRGGRRLRGRAAARRAGDARAHPGGGRRAAAARIRRAQVDRGSRSPGARPASMPAGPHERRLRIRRCLARAALRHAGERWTGGARRGRRSAGSAPRETGAR